MSRGRQRKSPSTKNYVSPKVLSKSGGGLKRLLEELRAEQKAREVEEPGRESER